MSASCSQPEAISCGFSAMCHSPRHPFSLRHQCDGENAQNSFLGVSGMGENWRREWDSDSHASFRFCKLQIPRCQGCRRCQRCRRALHRIAPRAMLKGRQNQRGPVACTGRSSPQLQDPTFLSLDSGNRFEIRPCGNRSPSLPAASWRARCPVHVHDLENTLSEVAPAAAPPKRTGPA
jgi:hypothetical protein